MFHDAQSQNAFFLLDEADSFFRDRKLASHRWEVSQVNELLVQMERFDGVFICATNHFVNFDKSSFRRFDFKIELGYMTLSQRCLMFQQTFSEISSRPDLKISTQAKKDLMTLDMLTPGDFALVKRRCEILIQKPTEKQLIEYLKAEHDIKTTTMTRVIGF